jgi:hypothetical protein
MNKILVVVIAGETGALMNAPGVRLTTAVYDVNILRGGRAIYLQRHGKREHMPVQCAMAIDSAGAPQRCTFFSLS